MEPQHQRLDKIQLAVTCSSYDDLSQEYLWAGQAQGPTSGPNCLGKHVLVMMTTMMIMIDDDDDDDDAFNDSHGPRVQR